MTASPPPTFWTRLKQLFTGTPVSYEEQRAARRSVVRDPLTDAQHNARDQRYQAGMF